jgi:hypothetical protein
MPGFESLTNGDIKKKRTMLATVSLSFDVGAKLMSIDDRRLLAVMSFSMPENWTFFRSRCYNIQPACFRPRTLR